jgi:tripartite-type tricarboxylate transporter receptor subunit TctC
VAGFNVRLWTGLLAPHGTPPEIIDRLAAATERALNADDVKATLASQGNSPMYGTPKEFAEYYQREVDKFAELIPVIGTVD